MNDLQQLLKGKTPVSVLQEICSKKKLTPTYNLLANEGPVHEPVFVMKAQAGDFQGTGKGSSKKKAKHNAASQLLCSMHGIKYEPEDDQLNGSLPVLDNGAPAANGVTDAQMSSGTYDADMQGNPIGELQEYTQKNLLRPPQYQFIGEQGPPHAREFVCTVKLAKLTETGKSCLEAVGKSKKIAKRVAASKLLNSVRQLQNDNTSTAVLDEEEDELPLPVRPQQGLKGKNIRILSAEEGKKANEFYENLRATSKAPGSERALQSLHTMGLNTGTKNFCQLLADLAKEKKFDVRYLELKEKSYSGQHQCLVQISTGPIAVCHGSGLTMDDAKTCAAHNALQYLKVMTAES